MGTMREALEAAFTEVEGKPEANTPEPDPVKEPVQEPSQKPEHEEPEGEESEPEEAKGSKPEAPAVEKPAKPAAKPSKYDKAPGSWKPTAREKWSQIQDPELREEIYRRDAEVTRGLNQSKKDAEFGKEISGLVAPFQGSFHAAGVTPQNAIQSLLQTDAILRNGTPTDKAQRAYDILAYYGVDIQLLSNIIQGTQPQQEQNPEVAQLRERLARLESGQNSNQQQMVTGLKAEVDTFAADESNEFYRDVRLQMATLLETGGAKDLKEAYDKACWADPDIRKVLLERQAVELSKKVSKNAARAREASSSLNGSGEPVSEQVDPKNLRAVLEHAWDSAGNRL